MATEEKRRVRERETERGMRENIGDYEIDMRVLPSKMAYIESVSLRRPELKSKNRRCKRNGNPSDKEREIKGGGRREGKE